MNKLLLTASLALSGCAGFGDITPEQAAVIMQMNQNQIANNNAMWRNMQANPVYQRQPVYVAPARRPNTNIQCVTRTVGGTSYTDCY